MTTYNMGFGAMDYSCQNMNDSYFMDDRGVMNLQTTLAYGNFATAALTQNIKTFIVDKRSKTNFSAVNREKSQYRLFFNDGYALYVTLVNGKLMGAMPIYYGEAMNCVYNGEWSNGNEVTFSGSTTTGHVYMMEVGSSFDGNNIDAFINLNWDAAKSPRTLKRYRKASIELYGTYYANLNFGYQLGYGTDAIVQPNFVSYDSSFSGLPHWDSFTWDAFIWDGKTLAPTECEMMGTSENVQFVITCSTDYIYPFTINSLIYHYTPRRGLR